MIVVQRSGQSWERSIAGLDSPSPRLPWTPGIRLRIPADRNDDKSNP